MSTHDLLAIRMLSDNYSDAANRMDPVAMASGYAIDGELVALGNPPILGRAAIEQVFAQTIGLMEFMNQICGGCVINLDGDRAKARWTIVEFTKRLDRDRLEIFLGTYDDDLVRTTAGWRFARRVLSRRAQARFEADLRN